MAKTLDKYLNENIPYGIEFVFFDGEEAFVEWTSTDSLYGSRHLADKWSNEYENVTVPNEIKSKINNIGLMLLLDLLGSPDPHIHDYYENTRYYLEHLVYLEQQLRKDNL